MNTLEYDLVAVGGGTAGLVSAAGASYLGIRAGLIEKEALGGDCLWTGCVPSKALIASARMAHAMRNADRLGLRGTAPVVAFREVMERMRAARADVAHHDDPQRFREMGIGVHFGAAHFRDSRTLEVEGVGLIRSKRMVIATGAVAAVPPIPGLSAAGFLTHATAFDQDELPSSMVILGGGPIGLEFAQTYARLGARVTVVEMLPQILPREDPDVAAALRGILEGEGVQIRTGAKATQVQVEGGAKRITLSSGQWVEGEEILVATGRAPMTQGLELDRAGVELSGAAVLVDNHLRTSTRGIWAAGDVTGGLQFTHVADYMANAALQTAIFPLKKTVNYSTVPWVTYTDPEVAHVGLSQNDAEERGGNTFTYPFADLDRAIVDGETKGFVKISADGKGRILGATILGHGAGELLMPLVLAMQNGIPLSKISGTIFPYPTRVEGVKRASDAFQRARLDGTGGRILRKVVSWLT
jgi:pyruvate/2-oxoglutarate dehydrogenase complex dihydrolipoamide dehydrogenase (E3) component